MKESITITLQNDFETEACADGNNAMIRLKDIVPQIVVLDLSLPGSSGREILGYIRPEKRLARSRVLLATADERQAETLTDAAAIVLLKPVNPSQVRELALRISK